MVQNLNKTCLTTMKLFYGWTKNRSDTICVTRWHNASGLMITASLSIFRKPQTGIHSLFTLSSILLSVIYVCAMGNGYDTLHIFYKLKLFAHIYIYMYMLAIAGQTAGPNWLKFCEETYWWVGMISAKKFRFFPKVSFFKSTGNAGHFITVI